MSKILGAIQQNRETLLQDWMKRLKSAIQRRDLINDRELENQASEMIAAIADVPSGTTLEDFNAASWQPLIPWRPSGTWCIRCKAHLISQKSHCSTSIRQQRSWRVFRVF